MRRFYIKSAPSYLKNFFATESPLKLIQKWFLFHLKRLFLSQDIKIFVLNFWSCRCEKYKKDKVHFKINDVATWKSKDLQYTHCTISQEVKTSRQWNLVSYYNIAWERFSMKNHTQNVVKKVFPNRFLESQNWTYFWIISLNVYAVYFYCMLSSRLLKYIESKLQTKVIKIFYKTKGGPELVSLPHFLYDFWRKLFLTLYFINWLNLLPGYPYFVRFWAIGKFWNSSFLSASRFSTWPKS